MDARPHPFAGKLSLDQAEEVRRLRARGLPLAEIAEDQEVPVEKLAADRLVSSRRT